MGDLLYKVGDYLLANSIKRALTGAGLAFASYQVLDTVVSSMIDKAVANIQSASTIALSFMAISGIDTALSIVASAMIARLTIMQAHLYLTKI